jgi:hypothetical protein
MPVSRSVVSVLLRGWETFLYILKAGPAGGRLRRPSSRRQRHDGNRGTGLTLHSGGYEATPGGRRLFSRSIRRADSNPAWTYAGPDTDGQRSCHRTRARQSADDDADAKSARAFS